eukprot:Hpha_TRINITY_DN20639_c0_g1::TRINITY_DN20639_c0_g1_i1::g.148101::m.148101
MPSTAFKDFAEFCTRHGLGSYTELFFDRGLRLATFHALTPLELKRMRITNTSLTKKLMAAASRAPRPAGGGVAPRPPSRRNSGQNRGINPSGITPAAVPPPPAFQASDATEAAAVPPSVVDSPTQGNNHPTDSPTVREVQEVNEAAGSPKGRKEGGCDSPPFSPTRIVPPGGTVLLPTANQCVRNAMVYVPPSAAKRERIVNSVRAVTQQAQGGEGGCCDNDKDRNFKYNTWASATAGGGNPEGVPLEHKHGRQSCRCTVCAELGVASADLGDRIKAVRRSEYQFPRCCSHDPNYPTPEYDYALHFRVLQLDLDSCEMVQRVTLEEVDRREALMQQMREEEALVFAQQRLVVEDEEEAVRRELLEEQGVEWRDLIVVSLGDTHDLSEGGRRKNYETIQQEQCVCLNQVESYERACTEAEEEAGLLLLLEVSAHLWHLAKKERRARKMELDALDYRSRCPVCWARGCDFFNHPWKPWARGRDVTREGARNSNAANSGIMRRGSFFKGHMIPTQQNMKILTGRCQGISIVSEYERLEMHAGARNMPAVSAGRVKAHNLLRSPGSPPRSPPPVRKRS